MDGPVQTILVPVVDVVPRTAIAYAQILSEAYNKPISFLCLSSSLLEELKPFDSHIQFSDLPLDEAVPHAVAEQDAVMVVFESLAKRRIIQSQLSACRELRIPYFFIPKGGAITPPSRVVLPMSFLIEDREKATWGRSLHHFFDSQFTILKPKDKGSRAGKNVEHVQAFFDKHSIPYITVNGKKSSFKNDKEALALFAEGISLFMITASREYGLDDTFLGPKELHVIRKSQWPIMMLNPRDDLYILCGD